MFLEKQTSIKLIIIADVYFCNVKINVGKVFDFVRIIKALIN